MTAVALVGDWWGYHAAALAMVPVATMDTLPPHGQVFCLNVSQIIPEELLRRRHWINFHASPLPFGRGGAPIENMIKLGHAATVITAHNMTSEIDAGGIIDVRGPISLAGTKKEIQARFIEPVAAMMREIAKTPNIIGVKQRGTPTYFRRLSQEDYRAFWASREKAA